ncbi:flocculation protein FLO11-like isoform X3 [Xiphophorus hellerii]|uniref:flocculation protein FLO11-like isoform X3 n=1 Tax=Xiphophorus hellerii TaxID=8084 RepID=UPI0013B38A96|nr:flocculation protein FLO11-like isoform X3 [Xiphophorus hellerii]
MTTTAASTTATQSNMTITAASTTATQSNMTTIAASTTATNSNMTTTAASTTATQSNMTTTAASPTATQSNMTTTAVSPTETQSNMTTAASSTTTSQSNITATTATTTDLKSNTPTTVTTTVSQSNIPTTPTATALTSNDPPTPTTTALTSNDPPTPTATALTSNGLTTPTATALTSNGLPTPTATALTSNGPTTPTTTALTSNNPTTPTATALTSNNPPTPTATVLTSNDPTTPTATALTSNGPTTPTTTALTSNGPTTPTATALTSNGPTTPTTTALTSNNPTTPTATALTSNNPPTPTATVLTSNDPTTPTATALTSNGPTTPTTTALTSNGPTTPTTTALTSNDPPTPTATALTSNDLTTPTSTALTSNNPPTPTATALTSNDPPTPTATALTSNDPTTPTATALTSNGPPTPSTTALTSNDLTTPTSTALTSNGLPTPTTTALASNNPPTPTATALTSNDPPTPTATALTSNDPTTPTATALTSNGPPTPSTTALTSNGPPTPTTTGLRSNGLPSPSTTALTSNDPPTPTATALTSNDPPTPTATALTSNDPTTPTATALTSNGPPTPSTTALTSNGPPTPTTTGLRSNGLPSPSTTALTSNDPPTPTATGLRSNGLTTPSTTALRSNTLITVTTITASRSNRPPTTTPSPILPSLITSMSTLLPYMTVSSQSSNPQAPPSGGSRRKRSVPQNSDSLTISSNDTALVFQGMEVSCSIKTEINQTKCTIMLALSHKIPSCGILQTLCAASKSSSDIHVVGNRIDEQNRLQNKCDGNLEEPNSCIYSGPLGASCVESGPAYVIPPINLTDCVTENSCNCSSYCIRSDAYYTFSISLQDPTMNSSSLSSLISILAQPPNCSITTNVTCQLLATVASEYRSASVDCEMTKLSCRVILGFAREVSICSVAEAVLNVFLLEEKIQYDGQVRRAAICGSAEINANSLNFQFSYNDSEKSPHDFCLEIKGSNLTCQTGENIVVHLKEQCVVPTTTSPNVTISPNMTSLNTTASPNVTSLNTTASPNVTSLNTTASPNETFSLNTTASPNETFSLNTTASPNVTSLNTTASPNETFSLNTTASPNETFSLNTTASPNVTSLNTTASPNETFSLNTTASPNVTSLNTTASPNETFSLNTTASPNETFSLNTTASPNETFSLNTTVSPNETFSLNTTASPNETFSLNTTASPNETFSLNTTASPNVTSLNATIPINSTIGPNVTVITNVTTVSSTLQPNNTLTPTTTPKTQQNTTWAPSVSTTAAGGKPSSNTTRSTTSGFVSVTTLVSSTGNGTAESQAKDLLALAQDVSKLTAAQIDQLVSQLEKLLSGPTVSKELGDISVNIVSNLLDASPDKLSSSSDRIIGIVDTVGLKLVIGATAENLMYPSLAVSVKPVDGANFQETVFSILDPNNVQVRGNPRLKRSALKDSSIPQGSITLPPSLTQNLTAEEQKLVSRLQFNFYQKSSVFKDVSLEQRKLNSGILGASVANLSIEGLKESVVIRLRNTEPVPANFVAVCVFWDFTFNKGLGGWNSDGCFVKETNDNETVCGCNHLTSFAILLDISRETVTSRVQATILTFITYIGCGLSAIFLSVTLLTYLAFGKLRKDIPSKILIQLCLALLLLNLVFLVDAWLALYPTAVGLCISTAWFLHYFLLVSFTWMGLEGVHMYYALVKVFNDNISHYMLKFSLVGWGVPMIVVIIVIAIDKNNYGLMSYGKFSDGTSDDFCWIRNDIAFYVAVVAYFGVIFIFNIIMFVVVLVQLHRIKKQNPHNNKHRSAVQDARSMIGITLLLGLTWGFAFFAWGPVNLAFMYLFAIFNSLQGFFIFVFHCAVKETVRRQWRTYLCCGNMRLPENSDWSRTTTQKTTKKSPLTSFTSSQSSRPSRSTFLPSTPSGQMNGIGNPLEDRIITADEEPRTDVVFNEINRQLRSRRGS